MAGVSFETFFFSSFGAPTPSLLGISFFIMAGATVLAQPVLWVLDVQPVLYDAEHPLAPWQPRLRVRENRPPPWQLLWPRLEQAGAA